MEELSRTERLKQHFKKYQIVYVAAAGGVVVGAAGVFVVVGGPSQVVDSFKLIHIQYKSPNVNIALKKQACPDPIPVRDKNTGIPYPSINQAMKITDETFKSISKDAQGDSKRWEKLPESVFA